MHNDYIFAMSTVLKSLLTINKGDNLVLSIDRIRFGEVKSLQLFGQLNVKCD